MLTEFADSSLLTEERNLKLNSTSLGLVYGRVTDCIEDGSYLIDNEYFAYRAIGCLIVPSKDDLVLIVREKDTKAYLLNVLSRTRVNNNSESKPVELSIPGNEELLIRGERLNLHGKKSLDLSTLGSMSLSACLGPLKITAKNCFTSVIETLVQIAKFSSLSAEQIIQKAGQTFKTQGRHQLISAQQDVKIDGERINMG